MRDIDGRDIPACGSQEMHTVQLRGLIFPVRSEGIGRHINLSEQQGSGALLPGISRHILWCKLIRTDMKRHRGRESIHLIYMLTYADFLPYGLSCFGNTHRLLRRGF